MATSPTARIAARAASVVLSCRLGIYRVRTVRSYGVCGYLMSKRTRSTLLGAVGVCTDFRKAWDRFAHFHRDCAWFWEVHAADFCARHRIARSCCFIRSRPTQYPRPTPTLRPTLCSYSRRPAAVRCQREAPVRQLAQRPLLGAVDGEGECSFHSAILTRSRRTLAAFSRASAPPPSAAY